MPQKDVIALVLLLIGVVGGVGLTCVWKRARDFFFFLMLIFFLYGCFNVAISDPKIFGVFELSKMVRGFTIFLASAFFVRSERELRLFIWALGCVVCYEG